MLDVHPPHTATHTWKDFFIHIATIVVGLLIAVGLEQTVEYVHHKREVAETRRELEHERSLNRQRFQLLYEELDRFAHVLTQETAFYAWLRSHPHAPLEEGPHHAEYIAFPPVPYSDAAWKTAQLSGVLNYMPRHEVEQYNDLYALLNVVNVRQEDLRLPIFRLRGIRINGPLRELTPQQIDEPLADIRTIRIDTAAIVQMQHTIVARYADFPDDMQFFAVRTLLLNEVHQPNEVSEWEDAVRRLNAINAQDDKD